MTQFNDKVEHQRLKLEAEQWANGIKSLHSHQIKLVYHKVMKNKRIFQI